MSPSTLYASASRYARLYGGAYLLALDEAWLLTHPASWLEQVRIMRIPSLQLERERHEGRRAMHRLSKDDTCGYCEMEHNGAGVLVGPRCGRPATQVLYWSVGGCSTACSEHGLEALTPEAREMIVHVSRAGEAEA